GGVRAGAAISTSLHGGRDSNSQPLVLETSALPVELPPYEGLSSSLPVCCVLAASRTELGKLDPVRIVLPVLRRRIRARPAGRARERDDRSIVLRHYASTFVTTPAPTVCPPSRIANRSPS